MIVGIGASAGGLRALEAFFLHMPADSGCCFVVVRHPSGESERSIEEALSRRTPLPIRTVEDGMSVEENAVFVIPPPSSVTLHKGALRLRHRDATPELPIDALFDSLAREAGSTAVGVVLSGDGSDGSIGARAIRDAGGLVLVQRPDTAEVDVLPRSVLPSAHHVLAPAEMPPMIVRHARSSVPPRPSSRTRAPAAIDRILALLLQHSGADFREYELGAIERRVRRRMELVGCDDVSAYVELVRARPGELDALCSDLQSGIAKLRRQEMAFARVGREHGEAQRGIVDAAERGVLDRSSSFPRAFESAPPATQPVAERPAPPAFRAAFESAPPATKPAAERPIAPAARRPPFESAPPETQLAGPSITDEAALRRRIAELEHELESTRERLHGTIAELRRHNEQLEAANQALAADGRRIRERLDLAVAFARLSFWDWDVTAGVIASVPDARSQNGAEEAPGPMRLEEWEARVHPDDRSLLRASYAACLTDGADSWSCEVRVRMPDESFRWVHQGGRVVERDANGLPRRILGTTQDVHARRTIENLVRRDAELLSKLQDSIFCTDPDGTITYWNDGAARLYGWSALEALGRTLAERVGRGAACDVSERLRAVLGGSDYQDEWEDVRKDGSRVWVDVRLTRFDDADGRPAGVIGISRDVTERKLLEATMRRDARILAELHDAVICGDATGNVVYLNAAAERIFGWNRAELLGRRVHEPLPAASAVLVERLTRRALAGEATESVDFEHRRADGSGVWIAYRAYPLLDAAGKVTGTVALATDVTERRRAEAERRQLEQQLLHAQKMEIIGTLAGGIAHDFNNILTAILMYAELCLLEAQQATSLSEGLNEIKAACLRAKDLVQRILTFSRFQEPEPKPVDLRLVVKDACKLLRVMLPATLDIRVDLPERPTSALADANQIHQVLLNLGSNAAHAMQNTGELTISVRAIGLDAPLPVRGGVLLPRRYVRIAVIDRGHGMSDETLARIFDPFFTTKRPGEGTGLGLPIVRGIVQNHGGGITVESVPGEGSVFTVYLPAALTPSTQMAAVQAGQATPRGRGERILVVDDEESVAILTKTALDSLGYRATHVTSVEDFLRAFEASPSSYRLILTDQTMPRLSGLDLARRVRAAGHTIPIIIATGFSRKLTPEAVATIGHAARLSKPFELHELAVLVHDLLERRAE